MRNIFIKKLTEQAETDKEVFLITADLGFRSFEIFKERFPDRFINVGVAENNMIGIASGMALQGKKVFVYSILPFLIFKCIEQIRNIICHNNLNIKLLGGGGGFSYSVQGVSHNTSEDISIIRSLPNIDIYNPGSAVETEIVMNKILNSKNPSFVRLAKAPKGDFGNHDIKNQNHGGLIVKEGQDLTVFCSGNILDKVVESANELESQGYSIKVVSIYVLKPVYEEFIINNIASKKILIIEEHSKIGGLGSIISEIMVDKRINYLSLNKLSLSDSVHNQIGTQDYLLSINNLDVKSIKLKMLQTINNGN